MAVTASPIYPQTITNGMVQILPADTTSLKTVYTAGTNGSRVECILLTNTDTAAAYAITFTITASATNHIIGTVNVPLSSGNTTAAPAISALASTNIPVYKDNNGNPYIFLASGSVLKANSSTTVNVGKVVDVIAQGEDF